MSRQLLLAALRSSLSLLALTSLGAQDDGSKARPSSPLERAADHAEAAAKLAAEDKPESAAVRLRAAIAAAHRIEDPVQRRNETTKLLGKMKTLDPNYGAERDARSSASRTLIRAADEDRKRGWESMARVLLEAANRVLFDSARAELAALGNAGSAARAQSLHDLHFAEARNPMGESGWLVQDDTIASPPLDGTSVMLVGNREVGPKLSLHAQVRTGSEVGKVALALGVTSEFQYHLLELRHDFGVSELRLFYYDGRQFHPLDDQLVTFTRAERDSWMSIEVEIDGPEIRASVGGGIEEVRAKTRIEQVKGAIGLFVSGDSQNAKPMQFRLLKADSKE